MRSRTPGFQPERLVEVREARSLTQTMLARIVDRSKSTVSKWEKGDQTPDLEALERLAQAVNVRTSYFLSEMRDHGNRPKFFRSMASTAQGARKKAIARMRWLQEISIELQEYVEFPAVNIPTIDKENYSAISDAEIEEMAYRCRRHWGIGSGPISDVLLVLENAGVVVAFDELESAKMDGLSNWSDKDGRPYVLLASDKSNCVRSRMDAAHELGHLVLHRYVDVATLNKKADFNEIERQAFLFASAFLMPEESFSSEVTYPSLDGLLALKERWKVSVAAMVMRCFSLGIIDDFQKMRLFKNQSQRGWRKQEPLDDTLPVENPRILARSIKLLVDESVLKKDTLLEELRLSPWDVEELTGLPEGYLSNQVAEVAVLPKLRTSDEAISESPKKTNSNANVITFPSRK